MSTSRGSDRLFRATVSLASALALGVSAPADAANCDVASCTAQLSAAPGLIVNDIFHDANGLGAQSLPVYGRVINPFPACPDQIDYAGAGHSIPPYDCPGEYVGVATTPAVANARSFLGALDRQWWQPCRLANAGLVSGCVADWSCIADDAPGNYVPWEGLVFDLGAPSNQVALFGDNDHAPQPCESLEYTVYFTDDPFAHDPADILLHPEVAGVDPSRWNRAVLSRVFTGGWTQVRLPDPAGAGAACGDTSTYSVESDSFAQVFALPCGITMRYVAIVAGNDGLDFPGCAYDSNEGELDAVVGLTASGAAVCPDADADGAVDCACPGAPPVCDCNDADPTVHPGATEACDVTTDMNCDASIGGCPGSRLCVAGACRTACDGSVGSCPPGTACSPGARQACLPIDCGCATGEVCIGGSCVSACAGVVCPGSDVCRDGECVDPCAGVTCAAGQTCDGGVCRFACSCYAGDVGCAAGTTCDRGGAAACVVPACAGLTCSGAERCSAASGACEAFCGASTACPALEHCAEPDGCVPLCTGVICAAPETCNAATGACDDPMCRGVSCTAPASCVAGLCVTPDAGSDAGPWDAGFDAGGVVGPDGGSTGTFDASVRDATATIDAGTGAPPSNAGCGCGVGGARTAGGWLVGLAWVAILVRRRRRSAS